MVLSKIIDKELEARKFADSAATMARDRTGSQINRNQTNQKAEAAAHQVCMHCRIQQDIGRKALSVFYEYQAAAEVVKSMKSRNLEVVLSGCIYLQMQLDQNRKCGRHCENEAPELNQIRGKLVEFCSGKGRGKDPFEAQIVDLKKFLNVKAFSDVGECIVEVRKRVGDWPDQAINCVGKARNQLIKIEDEKVKLMTVFKYTCLIYGLLCFSGFRKDNLSRIITIAKADEKWFTEQLESVYKENKLVLDKCFEGMQQE
ncbi:hypothetical protein SS50377_27645 [Spironucleus salmonicida]|nr:hypothetical protein SS50377_27645 [Spironucleus salmonicida]